MKTVTFPRRAGFSLIEVLIALSVFSFSIVSIIGMMSVGLLGAKNSVDTTVQSHIVQLLINDINQTQSKLTSAHVTYYDYTGQPTTLANTYYTATTEPVDAPVFGINPFPAQTVKITIRSKTNPKQAKVYSTFILN